MLGEASHCETEQRVEIYTKRPENSLTASTSPSDIVIFATGWKQSVPFLAPELRDAVQRHGRMKLYRFILPPHEQRLGFIGYEGSVACQLTSELGAHWLSQVFRGEMKLPSAPDMDAEIDRVEHWMSQVVPDQEEANPSFHVWPTTPMNFCPIWGLGSRARVMCLRNF